MTILLYITLAIVAAIAIGVSTIWFLIPNRQC
jgi:hypothetical protein